MATATSAPRRGPVLTGMRDGVRILRGPDAVLWWARFAVDPVGYLIRYHRRHGPLSALGNVHPFGRGERLHAVALAPEHNQEVLSNPDLFRSSGLLIAGPRKSAQRRVRYGLIRMNGPKHRRQRELLMPLFQKPAVEAYSPDIGALVGHMLDEWPTDGVLDVNDEVHKLSLRVSARILFGREDPSRADGLGNMIRRWMHLGYEAWKFPVNLPGTPYYKLMRHAARMERAILEMVEEKRADSATRADVLSILIRAHSATHAAFSDIDLKRYEEYGQLTDMDLVGQSTVLFAASFETNATALTWTLFLLAQHPQVMHDLLDELQSVLAGRAPTPAEYDRLPLLDAVIKESMRIIPVVPITTRVATAPARVGSLELSKGDRVYLSHYITHHLPAIYRDPERFRPERWFEIRPGPYEYIPLSAGPRMCIGYWFAMVTLKTALAMILQRFRLSVVPGARIDRKNQVTMVPKRGMPMSIHLQDRRFEAAPVRGNVHDMVRLPR